MQNPQKVREIQNLHNLDWQELLQNLVKRCSSHLAQDKVIHTKPLATPQAAQVRMGEIFMAAQVLSLGERPFMESLDFYETWSAKLKIKSRLKNVEFKDVRHFCMEVIALKEIISQVKNEWTLKISAELMNAEESLSAIDQIFTADGAVRLDASEKLYRLSKEKDQLWHDIHKTLDRLVKSFDVEDYLQDKYVTTREGRWVVPVKSGSQRSLPGTIHGASQTKQTVYVEPEAVVPMNNKIKQLEADIEEEVERLLLELSDYLNTQHSGFVQSQSAMLEADMTFAFAKLSIDLKASTIEFNAEKFFLNEVKHPLLALSNPEVVSNNVELDLKKRVLILTGPNAGGKTVLLKSIGLLCHMARCGMPVCSGTQTQIPFFKSIITSIGDSQSVDENLSTFAAHLKILGEAAQQKGPDSLVLVDEICGSTDPEEGSALGRSFIDEFCENKIFAVITSHLSPLKSGWDLEAPVLNGSMEYDSKTGRPTYQFLAGVPGDSLAIQTAKRVGVDLKIVDRAIEYLRPEVQARIMGLDEIERIKQDLRLVQDNFKAQSKEAEKNKIKYDHLIQAFEKEKSQKLEKEIKSAQAKVEEILSQVKVTETFQRHRALSEIKKELPTIIKSSVVSQGTSTESLAAVSNAKEFAERYPPGTKIFIPTLKQDGVVQSAPNAKGEVMVMSQSLRLTLPWDELKPAANSSNPTSNAVRRSTSVTVALQDSDRVVDVRGKTVEEAIGELEIALDLSSRNRESRMKVIHGHGTEALKKSVRAYLSRSTYVSKWKAGTPETGGDGITWVEFL